MQPGDAAGLNAVVIGFAGGPAGCCAARVSGKAKASNVACAIFIGAPMEVTRVRGRSVIVNTQAELRNGLARRSVVRIVGDDLHSPDIRALGSATQFWRTRERASEAAVQVSVYLSFNGDCEAAFQLYERSLGARIGPIFRYGDTPLIDRVPADWSDKIMHGSITVGDQVLMGADVAPDQYEPPKGISLSLHPDTRGGCRAHLRRARAGRPSVGAAREDVLGGAVRHGRRPLRHSLDDQLRNTRVARNIRTAIVTYPRGGARAPRKELSAAATQSLRSRRLYKCFSTSSASAFSYSSCLSGAATP